MTTTQTPVHDTTVVPSTIEDVLAEFAITATLLVISASVLAVGLGDPELLALVAAAGVVVLLGTRALLSMSERVRTARA